MNLFSQEVWSHQDEARIYFKIIQFDAIITDQKFVVLKIKSSW